MFDLLLVAMFVSFLLAILTPLTDLLSVFISPIAVNAIISLILSSGGNYLVSTHTVKGFIIKAVAGAFFGRLLLTLGERLATYRPVVINSARQ
jgi:hypothetical protein